MESLDLIKKLKLKRFIFYTSWRGHTFVGHIGGMDQDRVQVEREAGPGTHAFIKVR